MESLAVRGVNVHIRASKVWLIVLAISTSSGNGLSGPQSMC